MARSDRRSLGLVLATGLVAVAAVLVLTFTPERGYTPIVEVVGLFAVAAFAWFGFRWAFAILTDVYGD